MAKKGSPDDAKPGSERSAAPFVPKTTSIKALSAASHECRGCDLYKTATQVVFGAGPNKAPVMFVGEQPGDQEDRQGAPFVGPAGPRFIRRRCCGPPIRKHGAPPMNRWWPI
jgi:hypothetical protein